MVNEKDIEKCNCKSERYLSGLFGEELALKEMKKQGFSLVKQRYKTSSGEIDLIVKNEEQKLLVFIEVKRRKKIYDYENVITKQQWNRIYNASSEFLAENQEQYKDYFIRYDAFICFTDNNNTHHIENIFPTDFKNNYEP